MNIKPFSLLGCGPILIAGLLCQTSQAALTPGGSGISGAATLAATGSTLASEQLTVDWSVVEDLSLNYTYSYTIFNPIGDVTLPGGNGNADASEVVDAFFLDFNNVAPGALVSPVLGGTAGGVFTPTSLEWLFFTPNIAAGANSGPLSFMSLLPPSPGAASATDANPPSPWASYPGGGLLPVPGNGNFGTAPDATSTLTLLGGMMLLLPFRSAFRNRK